MSTEILILRNCDICAPSSQVASRPTVEGVEVTIGKLRRTIDLCEEHRRFFVEPLRSLLVEHGAKVEGDTAPVPEGRQTWTCETCSKPYLSPTGLRSHIIKEHPDKPATVRVDDSNRPQVDLPCPECGFVATNAQGLGAHRSRKHKVAGTSPAVLAKRAADARKAAKKAPAKRAAKKAATAA